MSNDLKIEPISGKWNFRLLRDGQKIYDVIYERSWLSRRASTQVNGQKIDIRSKSIWLSKFNIIKNDKLCGSLRSKWDGTIIIKLKRSDGKGFDEFILHRKGILRTFYVLENKQGEKLLKFRSKFSWSTFKYKYRIESFAHNYPDQAIDELLVYTGYAVNLSMMKSGYA